MQSKPLANAYTHRYAHPVEAQEDHDAISGAPITTIVVNALANAGCNDDDDGDISSRV